MSCGSRWLFVLQARPPSSVAVALMSLAKMATSLRSTSNFTRNDAEVALRVAAWVGVHPWARGLPYAILRGSVGVLFGGAGT